MNTRDFVKNSLKGFYNRIKGDIEKTYEHVYFVCRAASGHDDEMERISTENGTLHVILYNPSTCTQKEIEETIPENGVVEMDIQHGIHYQAWSTLDGYGASFRLINVADSNKKYVHLWNLEIGIWALALVYEYNIDGPSRYFPSISSDASTISTYDDGNGDYYDWEQLPTSADDCPEEVGFDGGIMVSSANSSFIITNSAKSHDVLAWSENNGEPAGLEILWPKNNYDYDAAQLEGRADFNGKLNTDKILISLNEPQAAMFAHKCGNSYKLTSYLPSYGELFLVYANKNAINSLSTTLGYSLSITNNIFWSSTVFDNTYAFVIDMNNYQMNFKFSKENMTEVIAFSTSSFQLIDY